MNDLSDIALSGLFRTKLQTVLSDLPVAMAWSNIQDGKVLFVNKRFTSLFGYEISDLTNIKQWIKLAYRVPDQVQDINKFWAEINTYQSDHKYIDEVELNIRCKDGTTKTVLSAKILLPNDGWGLATFINITDRKIKENMALKQAMEDQLTGLMNRRAFGQALEQSIANSSKTNRSPALLAMDLDGFKTVNDKYGHVAGDQILQQVVGRFKIAVRSQDILCRVGGDEFAVIINNLENQGIANTVAERIINCLNEPFKYKNDAISIGVSVGIASYPEDGRTASSLFQKADKSLYRAKAAGKGSWSR